MRKRLFGTLLFGGLILLMPQLAWTEESMAFANLTIGKDVLDNLTLPTIDGGQASLLDPKKGANVFIFFRSGAEPSRLRPACWIRKKALMFSSSSAPEPSPRGSA